MIRRCCRRNRLNAKRHVGLPLVTKRSALADDVRYDGLYDASMKFKKEIDGDNGDYSDVRAVYKRQRGNNCRQTRTYAY